MLYDSIGSLIAPTPALGPFAAQSYGRRTRLPFRQVIAEEAARSGPLSSRDTVQAMAKSGIAAGLNKGHVVTQREKKLKPSHSKGKLGKRTRIVREVVRDVAGLAPYERRVSELLKVGKDKRALKLCKKKLGTHLRAKKKREEMGNLLRKAKK